MGPVSGFLALPTEIHVMIICELLKHNNIITLRERKDRDDKTPFFEYLAINQQTRGIMLGYLKYLIFDLSIEDAPNFPLRRHVKDLRLQGIAFDPAGIDHSKEGDGLHLTRGIETNINDFGSCWAGHQIQTITLYCVIEETLAKAKAEGLSGEDLNEDLRKEWAEWQVPYVFDSLGKFAECHVRIKGRRTWAEYDREKFLTALRLARGQIKTHLLRADR